MGQKLTVLKIKSKSDPFNRENRPQLIAINKASIGYIWINGVKYGYNIDLLPTNHIDFDKELEPIKKKILYIRRK